MSYCAKCGNTGVLLNGEKCSCQLQLHDLYEEVSCFDIPEQYRSIRFDKTLIQDTWKGSYANFLDKLHTDLSTATIKGRNYLICSPPKHSKTILAYATMRRLFKNGLSVFPLYDVMELRNKISRLDMNEASDVEGEDLSLLFTVPYLFVKIPVILNDEVFKMCSMILDRRVRKGTSTIFLYNGSWEQLSYADKYNSFTCYQGDGAYTTVNVNSWKGGGSSESAGVH